jgi:hypothetical protein
MRVYVSSIAKPDFRERMGALVQPAAVMDLLMHFPFNLPQESLN